MCTHVHAIALHRQYSASILQPLILYVCSHRIHCVLPSKLLLMNLQSNFLHWKKNLQYIQGFHVYLGTKPTYKVMFSSWHTKHYTNVKRQSQNFLVPCIPRISDPCCKSQAQSQRMIFPLCFSGPRHFLRELAELGTLVMVTWEKRHPCSLTGNDANRIMRHGFSYGKKEGRDRSH